MIEWPGLDLTGRTAIVTGAASGIGRAIAIRFAAAGARVVLADLSETPKEGGESTSALIAAAGNQARFRKSDVSDWADVDRLVAETVERFGRLDVMVNNAATFASTPLLDTSEAEWDRVMAVNLKGVFFGCKRAVQQMIGQEPRAEVRGRIVNISSQHGMIAAPRDFAYGVSKAGVVYMTRQIASDYADQGIICNAVAPGKILTGRREPETIGAAALAYSRSRTPLPRLGRPADVASAALFLASDAASYITGENLMVDGGWMAS